MAELVTIVLPVYKRLEFLPAALESVRAQDYPNIELIVSDNGENGTRVRELVERHYGKPHKFRQNEKTVPAVVHYNQLVAAATGKYFVMLCDDDEISPNFVFGLVRSLECHPGAVVAIPRQDIIDGSGRVLRSSSAVVPEILSGEEFIRSWCLGEHKYECWVTNVARTEDVRTCGGYHSFPRGTFCEDALMLKLALRGPVVFSTDATFRWRIADDTSFGWSMRCEELAEDVRHILRFLETDPMLCAFAREQPSRWKRMRQHLVRLVWTIYFWRWNAIYRVRLPRREWRRAAFALPFLPGYYREVMGVLWTDSKEVTVNRIRKRMSWASRLYRFFKQVAP